MSVKDIQSYEEFKTLIEGDKPVLIDFWAPWCGPCRAITPIFVNLSKAAPEGVSFFKVNIDEQEQIAAEMRITSIPAFSAFVNGNVIRSFLGAHPQKLNDLVKTAVDTLGAAKEREKTAAEPVKAAADEPAKKVSEEPVKIATDVPF